MYGMGCVCLATYQGEVSFYLRGLWISEWIVCDGHQAGVGVLLLEQGISLPVLGPLKPVPLVTTIRQERMAL